MLVDVLLNNSMWFISRVFQQWLLVLCNIRCKVATEKNCLWMNNSKSRLASLYDEIFHRWGWSHENNCHPICELQLVDITNRWCQDWSSITTSVSVSRSQRRLCLRHVTLTWHLINVGRPDRLSWWDLDSIWDTVRVNAICGHLMLILPVIYASLLQLLTAVTLYFS